MSRIRLNFMGTNGWYATKLGNTVSILITTPERYIVLDAGDGIQHLDQLANDPSKPIDIFLSHFHLDHTIGLHIQPKFRHQAPIRIFVMKGGKKLLEKLIDHPYSAPFELLEKLGLHISVHELSLGPNYILPPVPNGAAAGSAPSKRPAQKAVSKKPTPDSYSVLAGALVHADPCWGYRFELPRGDGTKAIISYCTDTGPCENLVALSRKADALITECGLLPGDAISPTWPHLTPEGAAQAAKAAGVRQLYLTHFAANKYDTIEKRKAAGAAARAIFPSTQAAYDGLEVHI